MANYFDVTWPHKNRLGSTDENKGLTGPQLLEGVAG